MRRYMRIPFITLFLLLGSVAPLLGQVHVLLNIWDGTEMSVLEKLYGQGKLPFLKSVGQPFKLTSNQDCFNSTCMMTVTKPQHATMLTGCLADVHKVYSNNNYQLIPKGITGRKGQTFKIHF